MDSPNRAYNFELPDLSFGFLPGKIVAQIGDANQTVRVDAASRLLITVQTTSCRFIKVDQLIDFISPLLRDQNSEVIRSSYLTVQALISNLGPNTALYLRKFVILSFQQFTDPRPYVSHLADSILTSLISCLSSGAVISEILKASQAAPSETIKRVLEFFQFCLSTHALQPADILPLTFLIGQSISSSNSSLIIAAKTLLNSVNIADSSIFYKISSQIQPSSFLSPPPSPLKLKPTILLSEKAITIRRPPSSSVSLSSNFHSHILDDLRLPNEELIPLKERKCATETFFEKSEEKEEPQRLPRPKPEKFNPAQKRRNSEPKISDPKIDRFGKILEDLASNDWEKQGKAIQILKQSVKSFESQINSHVCEVIDPIVKCSSSLRTALSKSALECLKEIFNSTEINFSQVYERTIVSLLEVVSNGRNFVSVLAGDCVSIFVGKIPAQKAAGVLIQESKMKQEKIRMKATECLGVIAHNCGDLAPILRAFSALIGDANSDVRRLTREAVISLSESSENFEETVRNLMRTEPTLGALLNIDGRK